MHSRGDIMKRLYISDLDGTLLNNDQRVSAESERLLRECTANGKYFTFATARTAASAIKITENTGVNIPCVLMNGVSVYDTVRREYVKNEYISADSSMSVARLLDSIGQSAFMYKISGNKIYCEYTSLDSPEMREFFEIRRTRYDKPFLQIDSFSSSCDGSVVYFSILGSRERLEKVRSAAEKVKVLKYAFYSDIYSENSWYLEIFSEHASKYNGVRFLREHYGFDEIVCFGDNLNDLSMFEASDRKIAVANANETLKAAADEIIGSNLENSVAKYISDSL